MHVVYIAGILTGSNSTHFSPPMVYATKKNLFAESGFEISITDWQKQKKF